MKTGKLTENVWKRSVLKQMKYKREEVIIGAGVGEDCAILSFPESSLMAVTTDSAAWCGEHAIRFAIHSAVNDLAASGAEPVAVMLSALLPVGTEEPEIRCMMKEAEETCHILQVQAAGGHTAISSAVCRPVFTVTGVGKIPGEELASVRRIVPELDLVASKWIGLEGTAMIAQNRFQELTTKYPARMVREAALFDRYLSIVPEAALAMKSGVYAMHDVSEGGIFGALWEMGEAAGVGLEIELKQIPVRQETIELCEYYGLNPYMMTSGGCLLMAAESGNRLVKQLEEQGIPAAVIGRTTRGRDRVIVHGEEKRFLEPSGRDEIFRLEELMLLRGEDQEPV